jgi:hypothetical protein
VRRERGDTQHDEEGKHAIPRDLFALLGIAHDLDTPCLDAGAVKGQRE